MKILFRGLRADGKGWVVGDLCRFAGRHYIIPENQQFRDIEDPDFDSSFIEVTPKSVGQYTGMDDKNGRKVFVGDQLKNHKSEIGTVVWYNAGFYLECIRRNNSVFYIPLDPGFMKNKEIIRNVHEQ